MALTQSKGNFDFFNLYYISRFFRVLFKDQHGWSVSVDVELFLQVNGL